MKEDAILVTCEQYIEILIHVWKCSLCSMNDIGDNRITARMWSVTENTEERSAYKDCANKWC